MVTYAIIGTTCVEFENVMKSNTKKKKKNIFEPNSFLPFKIRTCADFRSTLYSYTFFTLWYEIGRDKVLNLNTNGFLLSTELPNLKEFTLQFLAVVPKLCNHFRHLLHLDLQRGLFFPENSKINILSSNPGSNPFELSYPRSNLSCFKEQ